MHTGSGSVNRNPLYSHLVLADDLHEQENRGLGSNQRQTAKRWSRFALKLCENVCIEVAHSVNMAKRENKVSWRRRNKKANKLQVELY